MDNSRSFRPARQAGIILHSVLLLLIAGAITALLILALTQEVRGFFILYLIASIVVFLPFPVVLYRLFSLLRAKYGIDRDGFHIQWGLRTEDIPMDEIEWMRRASDMTYAIPKPRFSMPGAILGTLQMEDLGLLEFLASDEKSLILIACRQRVLVVSPNDINSFQRSFRRYAEMGSITPIQAKSSNAEFLATTLFKDRYARAFTLGGLILSLILLIAVSFIIPSRDTIALGFDPAAETIEAAPSERLLLLPVATLFMLVADVSLGSYLYRKKGFRTASYLALASSLILPISFLLILIIFVI